MLSTTNGYRYFVAPLFMGICVFSLAATSCSDDGSASDPLVDARPTEDAMPVPDASPPDAAPPEGYTLENVCDRMPAALCAQRKPCCESNLAYDQADCEAAERASCEANVVEVKAATMTFAPDKIDACLTAQQPYLDACETSAAELFDIIQKVRACSEIFVGERAEGEACERNAQCAPAGSSDAAGCFEGVCSVARFLSEGTECTLGAPATFCEYRLYCDADLQGEPPLVGVCKPVSDIGESCEASSLVCGSQSYCEPATQQCTELKEGGEACALANECHSFDCQADGTCAPIRFFVSLAECTGQPEAD